MQLAIPALAAVEDRLALLDLPVFQQQGAQFAGGDLMLDTAGQVAQPAFLLIPMPGRKMAFYPLPQVDAFTHIEQLVLLAEKPVNTGEGGQVSKQGWIDRGALGIWDHTGSVHGETP